MNFVDSIKVCFKKFITFQGRASRSEYWFFNLFVCITSFLAVFLDILLFGISDKGVGPFGLVSYLIALIPGTSACVRRLHDVGKSGWLVGIGLLMFPLLIIVALTWVPDLIAPENSDSKSENLGSLALLVISGLSVIIFICYYIYLFYLTIIPGEQGANKYGENPLDLIHVKSNTTGTSTNEFELLQKLHDLHQKGILTYDEYNQRKNSILGTNLNQEIPKNFAINNSPQQETKEQPSLYKVQEIDDKIKKGQLTEAEAVTAKGKILGTILAEPTDNKNVINSDNNKKKTCIKCNNQTMRTMVVCPKCGSKDFDS